MQNRYFAPYFVAALLALFCADLTAQEVEPVSTSPQRTLLNQYCVSCHNERIVAGEGSGRMADQLQLVGLALDTANIDNVAEDPELWETVVRKLRVGAMPPQPRPVSYTHLTLPTICSV